MIRHDLKPCPLWTIGYDGRTDDRKRPMRTTLCLSAFDPMLEHPHVDPERDRCDHNRSKKDGPDLDGGGVDGNDPHDCLQ